MRQIVGPIAIAVMFGAIAQAARATTFNACEMDAVVIARLAAWDGLAGVPLEIVATQEGQSAVCARAIGNRAMFSLVVHDGPLAVGDKAQVTVFVNGDALPVPFD